MRHDCFADEIAIDFPSVDSAIERMRAGFLGARVDDVLRAELCVTQREARGGLVIPIEVPIRGMCQPCGGRGETWTEPCDECQGTGASLIQHSMRVALPPGVADGARLRFRVCVPGTAPVRIEFRVAIQPVKRGIA